MHPRTFCNTVRCVTLIRFHCIHLQVNKVMQYCSRYGDQYSFAPLATFAVA